jgi:glycosyltransferase involved in cell wall biosynthesis
MEMAAKKYSNIHYMPAVSLDVLQTYTVDADVGVSLIEDVCLSYRHCLPNKVFEYTACGVPSVVSDFREMGSFVDRYGCGWRILPTVDSLEAFLLGLTQEDIVSKRSSALQAMEVLGWENEEVKLLSIYRELGFSFTPDHSRVGDRSTELREV